MAKKRADYIEYSKKKKESRELIIYKANADRLLALDKERTSLYQERQQE